MAYSPDGGALISGSADWSIVLWNTRDGSIIQTLGGHDDEIYSLLCTPDGKSIVSASADQTIRIWEVEF